MQTTANDKQLAGTLSVHDEWRSARQKRTIKTVLAALKRMAGKRERCMYCLDSHGTDIEHFWPKKHYPERMYQWPNLLLCCTECGRFKGDLFPLLEGKPLLIDPTDEEPWQFLDFDPLTGNIVARYDPHSNNWSAKGLKTVKILQLDHREALAVGYKRTFRKLSSLVIKFLDNMTSDVSSFTLSLLDADEHGLLGWCFSGTGQYVEPFKIIRENHPEVWRKCWDVISHNRGY